MTKRVSALWTPWAEVLCPACHGSKKWNGKDITVPEQNGQDDEHGYCTKCGNPVWVLGRSDVAVLTRLRHKMGEGEMQQTGGMCAALTFERKDGGYVIATVDDYDPDTQTDIVTLGLWTKEGWEETGECVDFANYPVSPSFNKVRAGIRTMLDTVIAGGKKS